jgi:xanthine dehydrogenase YagT iron-sulfur-binding subunit
MTVSDQMSGKPTATEGAPIAPQGTLSRRAVLQLAGGAASLMAVPRTEAEALPSPTAEHAMAARVQLTVNGQAQQLDIDLPVTAGCIA